MSRVSAVATAPGRVNLIGEHTDYNHGLCLPLALSLTTTARAAPRTDGVLSIASAGYPDAWSLPMADLAPGSTSGWQTYAAGVVWALGELAGDASTAWPGGLDLQITSNVPMGAGLSSSAAVECAVAIAVSKLVEEVTPQPKWSREQLVAACIRAETEMAGAPTGGMDQTIAMFAPESGALLLDFADATAVGRTPVPLPLRAAGLSLLIVDTQVSHALGDGGYADRRRACERAAHALGVASLRDADLGDVDRLDDPELRRRARHVVTENQRVLRAVEALAVHDWDTIGDLFEASHRSMRDDFEISTPELDAVVETSVAAGAIAARMTGGGFGGSALVITPTESGHDVRQAVTQRFADEGWAPAHIIAARPGHAASLSS